MSDLTLERQSKLEFQPINQMAEMEKETEIQQSVFAEESRRIAANRTENMSREMPYETASSQVDNLMKVFDGILKTPSNSYFISSKEMAQRLIRIAETYRPELDRVSQRTAMSDPRIVRINRLLDHCRETLAGEVEGDETIEAMTSKIMDDNGDEESEGLNSSVDNTLSAETMQGVLSIDRWMLKHMHETGLSSIWGENDKFAFVSRLLSLSARERLYMYYVIEKGARHNVKNSDIIQSQISYVPNKKAFADKMTMSIFRVFRRVAMGKIYWDKLSDAYGQLESVRPAIQKYASIDHNKNKNSRGNRDNLANSYLRKEAKNGSFTYERMSEFQELLINRDKKALQRDQCLTLLQEALVDYKKKKEIADKAWFNKTRKKNDATVAAELAQQRLRDLLDSDEEVGRLEKSVRVAGHQELTGNAKNSDGNDMTEDGFSNSDEFADLSDRVVSNAGYGFSAVAAPIMDSASDALENESKFLGLSESGLSSLKSVNIAALSVLSVASIISSFIAIGNLISEGGSMMAGDLISATSDLVSQVLTACEAGYSTITAGLDKLSEATELLGESVLNSMEGLEKAAGIIGITTASVALTANTISLINSAKNSSYLDEAEAGMTANQLLAKNKDARKARFEENMIKHQKRVLTEQKKSTTISLVSNAALLTSALSGGTLSAVAGGISVGICIYSTIRDSIMGRKLKRQSVDDYLGLSGENNEMLEHAFATHLSRTRSARTKYALLSGSKKQNYKKSTINKLRENIRNEVMAKMGCASKSALFNKIMEKYGEIVYAGAFMNGDDLITDPAELEADSHKPYAAFINSLGLKIKFKDGQPQAPTQDTIVTKLQG